MRCENLGALRRWVLAKLMVVGWSDMADDFETGWNGGGWQS